MKQRYLLLLAALPLAAAAYAQQPPDPLQKLSIEWQSFQLSQQHVLEAINTVAKAKQGDAQELIATQQKLTQLKTWLSAWCGKKPGCAVAAVTKH